MATAYTSNLEREGQVRPFPAHGHATVGSAGGVSLLKGVFEPGWRWSVDVAPLAGTASCGTRHLGYVLSGAMHIRMDDGTELDLGAGDLFDLPPGHDAWVVGDEPCTMVDYSQQAAGYATQREVGLGPAADNAMTIVERGYQAFNTGDLDTLRALLAKDVVQHVPGNSRFAGTYKGIDSVLGYYATLGELTGGTFRAIPIELHGDHQGHVTAVHQISATRNGVTRVTHGSIWFTLVADRVTDLLELHSDLPGDDAFFA